jgi:hypothetical protein
MAGTLAGNLFPKLTQVEEHFDVVVIGGGPAGLAAGSVLARAGVLFAVFEAGLPMEARQRLHSQSAIRGVGGAGLYSDGKFSFYPSASCLWSVGDQPLLKEAYGWVCDILRREGLEPPDLPVPSERSENSLPNKHPRVKRYPSLLLRLSSRENLIRHLVDQVGSALRHSTQVVAIRKAADRFVLYAFTDRGLRAYSSRAIFLAGGRFGPLEMSGLMPDTPMLFRRFEIGIRVEQPSNQFVFRDDPAVDVKQISPGPIQNSEWRTFCTCRNGEVFETLWNHCRTYSGRADGEPSGRSNIGINLRFTAPSLDPQLEREIWDVLAGRTAPFALPAKVFLQESSVCLRPTLDRLFRPYFSQIFGAEHLDDCTVYGPCIEGVGYYPDVNDTLKVNSHEIWVAGDASGLFRGLTAALVSGYYCGKRAAEFLSAAQQLPHFVKESPSLPMPVAFTAQSKNFFYCRDAVCEYALRQGFLPLNPFRVFEYFLGDRVKRDLVRQGNNQLISIADEVWVFGPVSDGVLFEIVRARNLRKPVRFFTIATRADDIKPVDSSAVRFEPEVHAFQFTREDLVALLSDTVAARKFATLPKQLPLELE